MIAEAVIATALLGRPAGVHLLPERRAYIASAIAEEAGDDVDVAAALIVIGERESSWRLRVERCVIPGIGGLGAFGVAPLWLYRYPGATCGPITAQAHGARAIWEHHYRDSRKSPGAAFGRYIGARAGALHPEAQARARIFWTVRAQLECACCV